MKSNKNFKIFLIFIVVIILVLVCIAVNKYKQYKILMSIVEETNKVSASDNYYYEFDSESSVYGHIKIWVKGDYSKYQTVLVDGDKINYTDLKENKTYFVDNAEKVYSINNMAMKSGFTNFPNTLLLLRNEEKSFIDIALSIKELKTEVVDTKECYKIRYENDIINETIWIDKTTLLPIKNQNEEGTLANYTIILNNVTDDDVMFTNIDEYKLLEQ